MMGGMPASPGTGGPAPALRPVSAGSPGSPGSSGSSGSPGSSGRADGPDADRSVGTTYHLRPSRGWLNDPNGMVHRDGRWHVFYQHNPDGPFHHRIAWGHASTQDLVHWEHHPVALRPAAGGPDAYGCWSGVFVPGLARPAVVYSGLVDDTLTSTVCLRWGSPDLQDWGPPVVVATTPERDDVAVMRDPFLFRHGGRRWAVVGAGLRDGTPAALLYACEDILAWDYVGVLASGHDPALAGCRPADVWECPQLVDLGQGRWTLVLSLHDRGVLGSVVAVTGELRTGAGQAPVFMADHHQVLDTGDAFYAPQVAEDPDPGTWLMGWVRAVDRTADEADHAGCLTLPRRLVPEGQGCRLVLDPRVPALLDPTLQVADQRSAQTSVSSSEPVPTMTHPELGTLELPPGSCVYVDADVTEVFRPGLPPHTTRHDVPWSLPQVGR